MTKKEEKIPLVARNTTTEYGSRQAEQVEKKFEPSLWHLFYQNTWSDKLCIFLALSLTVFSSFLMPLTCIIYMRPADKLLPLEKLVRSLKLNGTDPVGNPEVSNGIQSFIDTSITTVYLCLVVFFGQLIANLLNMYLFGWVAARVTRRLRQGYIAHALRMDMSYLQSISSAQLLALLDSTISKINDALENNLPQAISVFFNMFFTLIVCFIVRWDIGLIMVAFYTPIGVLYFSSNKFHNKMIAMEHSLLGFGARIAGEALRCIKTVISYNGQHQSLQKFSAKIDAAMAVSRKRALRGTITDTIKILLLDGMMIITVVYGESNIGDTPSSLLIGIILTTSRPVFLMPILNMHANAICVAISTSEGIFRLLQEHPKIEVPVGEIPEKIGPNISFKNVTFTYPSRPDVSVLDNFCLELQPGEKVALVGESGCGKSTVAALLMRLFDPDSGEISIDGKAVGKFNVQWLRRQFGYVSQEPVLFDLSIRENVSCGHQWASSIDHKKIIEALNQANAMNFISEMSDGLDTRVGERGQQISGGQKQRIAIARALVRDPAIMIFDEATSSLDTENEILVQQAIDEVSEGRTTIIIAHRLSTVIKCDRIVVMNKGSVAECGSPVELIDQKNIFYKLLNHQHIAKSKVDGTFRTSSDSESSGTPQPTPKKFSKRTGQSSSRTEEVEMENLTEYLSNEDLVKDDEEFTSQSPVAGGTMKAVKDLLALEPHSKRLFPLISLAAIFRGTRTVVLIVSNTFMFDALSYSRDEMIHRIMIYVLVYSVFAIAGAVGEILMYLVITKFSDELTSSLSKSLFNYFLSQRMEYFDKDTHDSGTLNNALSTHPANIREAVSSRVPEIVTMIYESILAGIISMCVNAILTPICGGVSIVMVILRVFETAALIKEERKLQPLQAKANAMASEALLNIQTVKAFGLESYFLERYRLYYDTVERQKMKRVLVNSTLVASSNCIGAITCSITFMVAAYLMVNNPYITLFNVMCCQFLSYIMCGRLLKAFTQTRPIARCLASCKAATQTIQDGKDKIEETRLKACAMPEIKGDIVFDAVSFSYPSRLNTQVLNKFSTHIKPGKTVAVVGPSGCGKSTIVQLVLGLYDVNRGTVSIDNTEVSTIDLCHLHNSVVPVSQEPILFDGTIFENIIYGLHPTEFSEDQVYQAAKDANIHDFVISLPQGYQTKVGEMGAQVSGGQKQRIAIARALIRRPAILLLDEATAALDNESEAMVQQTLDKALEKHTCVMIAHRLSTVEKADKILVVRNGKIAEQGTHNQLLNASGMYYRMYNSQQLFE